MSKATNAKKTEATTATATTETTANPKKARLELCDWKEGIPASLVQSKSGYSMKVRPKRVMSGEELADKHNLDPADFIDWLQAIEEALRDGFDVNIGGAVHAYVWVNPDGVPTLCLKSIGNYRKCIADKAVRPFVHGHETNLETAREMRRVRKAELDKDKREHVTPSTVVTCPVCGTEFRVGKALG